METWYKDGVEVCIFKTSGQVGEFVAKQIASQVISKQNTVLGLATGSSPIPTYQELIRLCKELKISFQGVSTVNLDEYVGITKKNPQSYAYFMKENLLDHLDIDSSHCYIPNSEIEIQRACLEYQKVLEEIGTRDIQIVGIGPNGHIGFNEPGTFIRKTHCVELTEQTRIANARFFEYNMENVPTQAITMGWKEIMDAKHIILIATGIEKADPIKKALEGPLGKDFPASLLREAAKEKGKRITFVVDKNSASLLELSKYYQEQ